MGEGYFGGLMEASTRAISAAIKPMDTEESSCLLEIIMWEIGLMIRCMVMGNMCMPIAATIRVSGWTISSVVWEEKHGRMAQATLGIIKRGKVMGREFSFQRKAMLMKEILKWGSCREMEFISGRMAENIKVNGRTTKCTGMDDLYGQMEGDMKGSMCTISTMVKVNSLGPMEASILELGATENSMEKGFTLMNMVTNSKASG
jgi:hypothetical protein